MQCPYVGLTNQSSTCYMNSYLQYLYMYKEFRAVLFSLDLKPDNKEDEKDCIPFQLQKLFSKLNLKKNKQISTKELTASFQWTVEDVFAEHDVSEFSKLLIQAFRDSLDTKNIEFFNWLTDLSEGTLSQYILCETCGSKSVRQEKFSEINLIIKNEWENLYFKKLENSFIETIKPIKLYAENAYFCDTCHSKQNAEKGLEYTEFPKVLVFNLSRFVFDLEVLQRKKLDEYFEFPLVLDLSKFKETYKEVAEQHKNLAEFDAPIEKTSQSSKNNKMGSDKILSINKGKKFKNVKPSSLTKDFLKNVKKNMKKTSKLDMEILVDEKTVQNIEESRSLGVEVDSLSENDTSNSHMVLNGIDPHNAMLSPQLNNIYTSVNTSSLSKIPIVTPLEKDVLNIGIDSDQNKSESDKLDLPVDQFINNHSMDLHIHQDDNIDDQKELHSLQAVFIHKGSAFTGHYYIYIKSFENNIWYLFDDYQVQEVNLTDVLKDGFGGHRLQINAYMLVYRSNRTGLDVMDDRIKGLLTNLSCPHYMQAIIEQEMKLEEEILKKKALMAKNKKVKHKIFFKLQAATVEIEPNKTFTYFEEKCFEAFKIPINEQENCRIRLYNKLKDEMMNTFESRKSDTIEKLKLNVSKNFIIEVKEEGQEFEEYKAEALNLKLVFWTPEADEIDYQPDFKRVDISKNAAVKNLIDKIKNQFPMDPLFNIGFNINIVYKHTYKNGSLKGENFSLLPDKKLVEFFVTNNTVLYIDSSDVMVDLKSPFSHWVDFFEKENNKIVVNFNYPVLEEHINNEIDYSYKLKIDMNLTIRDLKDRIIEILKIDPLEDFIIKKGGKSGVEIKDFAKVIRTFRIINNSFVFLVFGQSTSVNEIKVNLFLAVSELQTTCYNLHRDLIFIKEIAINPYLTPSKLLDNIHDRLPDIHALILQNTQRLLEDDLKPLVGVPIDFGLLDLNLVSNEGGIQITNKLILDPQNTRLREKTGNILTRCYHNYSLKNQGVVERKKIVIEPFKRKLESNEILVYYCTLDCKILTLSPAIEVIVNKKFNLLEFSSTIVNHGLNIDIESLEATKIRDVRDFVVEDILDHSFFDMSKTDMLLSSAPFYLETDGCLFM